jgi:hypothetical protein
MVKDASRRYRVIEATLDVVGGTPVEGLERLLNDMAVDGYRLVTTARVREPGVEAVDVLILERIKK